VGGLKLTIFAQILPPSRLINQFFVTNGTHTAILSEETFEESKLFSCSSIEAAQNMQCHLQKDSSICHPAEKGVNCDHKQFTMKKVLEEDHLPKVTPQLVFEKFGQEPVEVRYTEQTSISVIVTFDNLELETLTDEIELDFKVLGFGGCAGCESGAELKFRCVTNVRSALAHVQCPSLQFDVRCFGNPHEQALHVDVRQTVFAENCTILYPGGKQEFFLEAEFVVAEMGHINQLNPNAHARVRRFGRDYMFLIDWIWITWWMPFVVGTLATLLVISIFLATCPAIFLAMCCSCWKHRKRD
jgi:hypothetical protein